MEVKYINPFLSGMQNVLEMLGISGFQRGDLSLQKRLLVRGEVNVLLGFSGQLRGNIVFSMSEATACGIAGAMMGGMLPGGMDDLAKSALCELGNMIAGFSTGQLEQEGILTQVTPPTLVSGKKLVAIISTVETLVVQFRGALGTLEVNLALEI